MTKVQEKPDVCSYCDEYEVDCSCTFCGNCGEHEDDCHCVFCRECGEIEDDCYCDDSYDEEC